MHHRPVQQFHYARFGKSFPRKCASATYQWDVKGPFFRYKATTRRGRTLRITEDSVQLSKDTNAEQQFQIPCIGACPPFQMLRQINCFSLALHRFDNLIILSPNKTPKTYPGGWSRPHIFSQNSGVNQHDNPTALLSPNITSPL